MKIRLNDGKEIEGKNAKALVKIMRDISFDDANSKSQYMMNIQKRVSMLYETKIRVKTCEQFLEDLQCLGLIKFIEE